MAGGTGGSTRRRRPRRTTSFGRAAALGLTAALALAAGPTTAGAPAAGAGPSAAPRPGRVLYVSPAGEDRADGRSQARPLRTINRALALARPGDTVRLAPGRYPEDVATVRDGTAATPITVTGPPEAVVSGAGGARVWLVRHDHHTLDGFTVDGLRPDGGARDKLVFALGARPRDGVDGLRLLRMTLQNAGGECVRLRYFARGAEIAWSTIRSCGRDDFPGGAWAGKGKNGEGVYIGTAPDQWGDGKNPTADPDRSEGNWVHDNRIDTQGNECVDVKEGARANVVERNHCTGQRDPESAGFDSRGNANVFRANVSVANLGAGVRLGGHTVNGVAYGQGNEVVGNRLEGNAGGGVKLQAWPQGRLCGNVVIGAAPAAGAYAHRADPTAPCPTTAP